MNSSIFRHVWYVTELLYKGSSADVLTATVVGCENPLRWLTAAGDLELVEVSDLSHILSNLSCCLVGVAVECPESAGPFYYVRTRGAWVSGPLSTRQGLSSGSRGVTEADQWGGGSGMWDGPISLLRAMFRLEWGPQQNLFRQDVHWILGFFFFQFCSCNNKIHSQNEIELLYTWGFTRATGRPSRMT